MTGGGKRPVAPPAEPYSPRRRSALILVGTGTSGAYHAGVLRALHEAGTKIDVVAGQGMGAVSALLAAIDAGSRLGDEGGFWRRAAVGRLYPWHPSLRMLGGGLAAAAVLMAVPLVLVVIGLFVFGADFAGQMVGVSHGGLAADFSRLAAAALAPPVLPTWLPRLLVVTLGGAGLAAAVAAATTASGRYRVPLWRRAIPSPLAAAPAVEHCWSAVWDFLRGASDVRQPPERELARRCTEVLTENLGQPGFRELVIVAHDLDTHRDVIFALVPEGRRPSLTRRQTLADTDVRRGSVVDLCSFAGEHLADAVAAALAVPVVTDAHPMTYATDSFWRGETHRLCDRPAALHRLVDELSVLGVEELILVSAAPEVATPHALASPRLDARGRIGAYLQATEAACVHDVVGAAQARGAHLHLIRPAHNPVGPFDFKGGFDDRSNRWQAVSELIARGYEDAYRQFVEPIMGPSGDAVGETRLERGSSAHTRVGEAR